MNLIDETENNASKAEYYYRLGFAYHQTDADAELIAHLKAENIFNQIQFNRFNVLNKIRLGYCYLDKGDFIKSENYFLKAITIARAQDSLALEIEAVEHYHNRFININSPVQSLERALDLKQRTLVKEDKKLLFKVYELINDQYLVLGTQIDERKKNALEMLQIANDVNDSVLLKATYFNLAVSSKGQESIDNYKIALTYSNNDKYFFSSVYNNISGQYRVLGQFDDAINYADSAYQVSKDIGRKEGMAAARYRKSEALYFKEQFKESITNAKEALTIFNEANILRRQSSCTKVISAAYKELGDYKQALEYFELTKKLSDSLEILTQAKEAEFVGRKFQFELEKRRDSTSFAQERAINELELDNINTKLEKEKTQRYALIGGVLLALILAITLFVGFQRKKRDNKLIEKERRKADEQRILVEEKNQEITDSIVYAKRIQSAILPPNKIVKEYLKDSFIIYKPKDIVAGDFYWLEHKNGKILFAAADCTGHGVPGAMVSVVCNNALNRSVREHGLIDPGKILNKTREIVIEEFEKSDDDVNDGMDIALCSLEGNQLQYAGANNPLWIIRKGEIIETKGTKQPIGKFDHPEPYLTHHFELEKEDTIYIFSDGFVDQFGGLKGKKFKASAFKELLLSIQDKPMDEQKEMIEQAFNNWMGNLEQVDDVCVIGVKI